MLSSVSRVSCFVIQNSISYPSRVPDSCETAFPLPTLFLPYLALLQPSFPFLALPYTQSLPFLAFPFLTFPSRSVPHPYSPSPSSELHFLLFPLPASLFPSFFSLSFVFFTLPSPSLSFYFFFLTFPRPSLPHPSFSLLPLPTSPSPSSSFLSFPSPSSSFYSLPSFPPSPSPSAPFSSSPSSPFLGRYHFLPSPRCVSKYA